MKDNFSSNSDHYKKYRPTYPQELFEYLISFLVEKKMAWDCGTGNGQVAHQLSQYFELVFATDISKQQINHAVPIPNIHYAVQKAESTTFPDNQFDLITVAQAIHWFDFHQFYKEVNRTLKPQGIIAVIGYGLIQTIKEADDVILHLYKNILGPYWDKERRYIDENYKTIPFPFKELVVPEFKNELNWSFDHLINYLETWSAVKHYKKETGKNPIDLIYEDLKRCWKDEGQKKVVFPILLRTGKKSVNYSRK